MKNVDLFGTVLTPDPFVVYQLAWNGRPFIDPYSDAGHEQTYFEVYGEDPNVVEFVPATRLVDGSGLPACSYCKFHGWGVCQKFKCCRMMGREDGQTLVAYRKRFEYRAHTPVDKRDWLLFAAEAKIPAKYWRDF